MMPISFVVDRLTRRFGDELEAVLNGFKCWWDTKPYVNCSDCGGNKLTRADLRKWYAALKVGKPCCAACYARRTWVPSPEFLNEIKKLNDVNCSDCGQALWRLSEEDVRRIAYCVDVPSILENISDGELTHCNKCRYKR
jgi:DNA-directed RNA polymerase subunit RPC12/RpoP